MAPSSPLLAALAPLVASLLASRAAAQSFTFADFSATDGLSVNGHASAVGGAMRLTNYLVQSQHGSAWFTQPVSVASGFDTTFTFRIWPPVPPSTGADGLAFVIQNDPDGATALGSWAAAMGYGASPQTPESAVGNSLVLEVDTFQNAQWLDPDSNHLSLHTNGVEYISQDETASIGRCSPLINVSDGQPHTLRLRYVPGQLRVFLDDLTQPVLTVPYDIVTGGQHLNGEPVGGVGLLDGARAYVGFTSGTGAASQNHDVLAWTWESTPVVSLDVRPGACPNPFNPASHGFLSVALAGGGEFDPALVDLTTLELRRTDGAGRGVTPSLGPPGPRPRLGDVTRPFEDQRCGCGLRAPDGRPDLLLWFRSQDVTAALQLGAPSGSELVSVELSGSLADGRTFQAEDCLWIVPSARAR